MSLIHTLITQKQADLTELMCSVGGKFRTRKLYGSKIK